MVKSLVRLTIILFLIYLWVLNPIPFVSFEESKSIDFTITTN